MVFAIAYYHKTQMIIGLFIGIKIVAFNTSDHKIIKGVLTAHLSLLVI